MCRVPIRPVTVLQSRDSAGANCRGKQDCITTSTTVHIVHFRTSLTAATPALSPFSSWRISTHLPEEVLTRVFGSILHCAWSGAPGEFGPRAARHAKDALALAKCSRRLSEVFGSCLVSVRICTPSLSPRELCSLVRVAGAHLRNLTLGETLAPSFAKAEETVPLFTALAEQCVGLNSFSFCARSVCVQDDGETGIIRPFVIVCERLTSLDAQMCSAQDMWTVCKPDYSRLTSLSLSVDNTYECDVQLSKLWATLGDELRFLSLRVWSYDGSRQNARGSIVGDGLESFRILRAKNLPLETVRIGRFPIRALILTHSLLIDPPNSNLRIVELRNAQVWPFFMGKLASVPTLRVIRVEYCRIDAQDVPAVVKKAGGRLHSFWANLGHWTMPNQLAALRECPNLEKADLYCRYEHAQEHVREHCEKFGEHINDVRVGGPGFEAVDVLEIVRLLPNLTALWVCNAPFGKKSIETLFEKIGSRLEKFSFDCVDDDMDIAELFALVERYAPHLKQLSFPFTKMIANMSVEPGLNVRDAMKVRKGKYANLLDQIEEKAAQLDVEALRISMRQFTG